jgi:cellulose synthase/poly-beta-1,6-N-acetylglucosamine synthase-like glycosyltransferase
MCPEFQDMYFTWIGKVREYYIVRVCVYLYVIILPDSSGALATTITYSSAVIETTNTYRSDTVATTNMHSSDAVKTTSTTTALVLLLQHTDRSHYCHTAATTATLTTTVLHCEQQDPADLTMIQANMQLAEDRAFTFFLCATSCKRLGYIPDALLYYDVECKTAKFLSQRRRWLNGGQAALADALAPSNFGRYWGRLPLHRAVMIIISLWMYVLTQIIAYIYPAILSSVVYSVIIGLGADGTLPRLPGVAEIPYERMRVLGAFVLIAYWAALGIFLVLHHFARRVHMWSYCLCLSINTVCSLLTLMWAEKLLQSPVLLGMMITVYMVPVLNSILCRDARGFMYTSLYGVAFYLYSPTFMLCAAYAVAQSFNLSWGNR